MIAWGLLLGGKLFDHVVLAGAWSANPPESLELLPYGPQYPVDTGDYFFPASVALLACSLIVFATGWRTPMSYRVRLFLPPVMLLVMLAFTILWFWPANASMWAIAKGTSDSLQDESAIKALVRQWLNYDRIRIAAGAIAFVICISAISMPYPGDRYREGE